MTESGRVDWDWRIDEMLQRIEERGDVVHAHPIQLSSRELAGMIDHTQLKAEATPEMIDTLCRKATEYGFISVCVNPVYVARCVRNLQGSDVLVCSVNGFPLGATMTDVKVFEARRAIEEGAQEIDMVIHVGALKAGEYNRVRDDVAAVADLCHERDAELKVIIEAALLTRREKVAACLLAVDAGADFVKTSTGFGPGGAAVEDVALMRAAVGPDKGIKAAGGIRTYETALAMVRAGATRIGASSGIQIIAGAPQA